MDSIFQAFLNFQFLFFCIAIGAVVFILRIVAEYMMANWASAAKESKLWRDLILPILPILLGQFGAFFFKSYPYPEGFNSNGGRVVFGLVAGFSSGLIVRLYRSFLSSKVSEITGKIMGKTEDDPGASVRDTINKDQ